MTKSKMETFAEYSMEQLSDLVTEDARDQGVISEFESLSVVDWYFVNDVIENTSKLKLLMEMSHGVVH